MKTLFRLFSGVAAIATTLALFPAADQNAHAATLTYTDPLCSSFTLTGSGNSATLICNKMACSIGASPSATQLPGSPISLSANCSNPTPTNYTWTLVSANSACPTVPADSALKPLALVASAAVTGCVYQLDAVDSASGKTGQATVTLGWSVVQAALPAGCTISANPSSLPASGGPVTLTAACSNGTQTSYRWSGGSIAGTTTSSTVSTNITATTTFSVTPFNATGDGNTASVTVNVGTVTSGNEALCTANFAGQYKVITLPWAGQAFTYSSGSMLPGDVIAFKFTVPVNATNTVPPVASSAATISVAEYSGPITTRTATLSPQACDFRGFVAGQSYPTDPTGATAPLKYAFGTSPNFNFIVSGALPNGVVTLTPGKTYYINVRNIQPDSGSPTCSSASCDILASATAPR